MPSLHQLWPLRAVAPGLLCLLLAACAGGAPHAPAGTRVLVFGEQHDQPDHQRQVAAAIDGLAAQGRLGALVLEMAEQGRGTAGLPRDADAARVQAALAWAGWDWAVYEPVVMAAVRVGVPVLGGNLPRERVRPAMADAGLTEGIDAGVQALLTTAVRDGHCGLLPARQEPAMVRVQIARDRAMAESVQRTAAQAAPETVVVLLTGAQHASRDRGVPWHLARAANPGRVHVVMFGSGVAALAADELRAAVLTPRPDPCQELRRRLARPRPAAP